MTVYLFGYPFGSTIDAPWDLGVHHEVRTVVEPTALVATVDYIRDLVLRAVNGPVEDEHIRRLILAASSVYEGWTEKALMPRTEEMIFDRFPAGKIRLDRPPLIEVESVSYYDETGTAVDLVADTDFLVKPSGTFAKAEIWPYPGHGWPTTQGSRFNAVTVTYQAGVPDVTVVPSLEREIACIALLVAECYSHRLFNLEKSTTVNELVRVGSSPNGLQFHHFWKKAW